MSYKGFNPVAFARSAATTLAKHMTEVEEAMLRSYAMGALLDAAGRVSYSNSGEGFDWPVQYRLHQVEGNTGQTVRNFARRNLWKTAYQEYRGYQATDAMYYREFRSNRGPEGIVKVYDRFVERLTTSMKQALGKEYYVDGGAAGNEEKWHGLDSIFPLAATAQTVNISTGAARTANAADVVGYPEGTYAGLTVNLGNYGGEQESGAVWPAGISDSEYDFWTPMIVNYTSTDFNGTADTFAAQGDEAMRYGIINSQRNTSMEGQITQIILARDLYTDFLNLIDDKERIQITSETGLRALGFKNVVNFDGVEVTWETACPTGEGYGININNMELLCMDDTFIRSEGPEYDIDSQAFKAVVSTLSNMKFSSPRNFFKLQSLA